MAQGSDILSDCFDAIAEIAGETLTISSTAYTANVVSENDPLAEAGLDLGGEDTRAVVTVALKKSDYASRPDGEVTFRSETWRVVAGTVAETAADWRFQIVPV